MSPSSKDITRKVIGDRLRQVREAPPYWSRPDLARLLRAAADPADRAGLPHVKPLAEMIKHWENGKHAPGDRYRPLYAKVTGIAEDELFAVDATRAADAPVAAPAWPSEDIALLDLAAQAGASDLPSGTLELLDGVVDRLCRDYPTVAPETLSVRGRTHLEYVLRLLNGRVTLREHRELLVHAGWLAALLSCSLYDAGNPMGAEVIRRTARRLGEQAGHGEIVGWSWEIAAWFALVELDYPKVVTYAEAGLKHAGISNGAVQLTLQAGRGYARMGDRRARDALRTGRAVLDQLPVPVHPEHHFVFDRSKYEFYCSTIYAMLGQDDAAEEHAHEVIAQCRQPDGSVRWPMRYAMVNVDLGLVAGRSRELDRAVQHGRAALEPARHSGDLLPRARELCDLLDERYPRERRVAEFAEQLRGEQHAVAAPADPRALP